jgi:hypothetical protein
MKKRIIALILALALMLPAAFAYAGTAPWSADATENPAPDTANDTPLVIDYAYEGGLVSALYNLYGSLLPSFVDFSFTNNTGESVRLLAESEISGYSTVSADTVDVAPGTTLKISQNPRLKPEKMDEMNSQRPGTLLVRVTQLVEGADEVLLEESKEILLYSRRDFVWIGDRTPQEDVEFYCAWITPTDPVVEELLRNAADYTDSGQIGNGYGGHTNDESGSVWDRLEAIWRAEQDLNLTYVSTMLAFSPGTVQRMRTPYEVVDQRGGNCIETTCLFLSAVEALELEGAIVLIPGHAFAAIRTDQENAKYYFVETTFIGQEDFSTAVDYAASEWDETLPHLDAGDDGYYWVDIQEARDKGILPIPWR